VDGSTKPNIGNISKELVAALRGTLSWKWDRRFETVLAEFKVEEQDRIRANLQRHLRTTWDSANVGNAPEIVRIIHDNLGGIRPGQFLFTSDPSQGALLFCTWWPWDDGKAISIRIGAAYPNLDDAQRAERVQSFKSWFGV
jgi:hypothetical protein